VEVTDGRTRLLGTVGAAAPDQPDVLNQLGFNWVERNLKLKEGLALLEKAVKLRPDDGNLLDSLGWARYRHGDHQAAIKVLERAAALELTYSEVRDHLGDAYWRTGRQDEARRSWEQALSLKPDPADTQKIKGMLSTRLHKPGFLLPIILTDLVSWLVRCLWYNVRVNKKIPHSAVSREIGQCSVSCAPRLDSAPSYRAWRNRT